MIEAQSGTWYFIFPFLLDPIVLNHEGSWLKEVYEGHPDFQQCVPDSRKGFLPIRSYKAMKTHVMSFERRNGNLNEVYSYLPPIGKIGASMDVVVKEAMTIYTSGIGMLTYEVTPLNNSTQGLKPLKAEHFQLMSRLVPRTYGWKDETDSRYKPEDIPYSIFNSNKMLHQMAYERIQGVKEEILQLLKIEEASGFWEDLDVYLFDEGEEFFQPYVITNLEIDRELFVDLRPNFVDNKDPAYHEIVRLVYRFWRQKTTERTSPDLIGTVGNPASIKVISINRKLWSFVYHTTTLNLYSTKADHAKSFILPSFLSAIEHTVAQMHFASTLDALIDKLLNDINEANSLPKLEYLGPKVFRLQLQIALSLETISQYVKTGQLGTEMTAVMEEVFKFDNLALRTLRKIDLADRVRMNKIESLIIAAREKDIDELKKMG